MVDKKITKSSKLSGSASRKASGSLSDEDRAELAAIVGSLQQQHESISILRNQISHFERQNLDFIRVVEQLSAPRSTREVVEAARHEITALLSESDEPIVAGPWLGEVGFELLYWVPFLTWAQETWPELRQRLVIVSRGGSRHWYSHISSDYVEIFDHFSTEEIGRHRKGTEKQINSSPLDDEIVKRVQATFGCPGSPVLSPAVMYRAFRSLAKQGAVSYFRKMSSFHTMNLPDLGKLDGVLPDEFIAVKFYFNASFENTEQNQHFAQSIISRLLERTNVVLLNTGIKVDDHSDFDILRSDRLIRIDDMMVPSDNLMLQTVAISRAQAFVGTYGGLSYLAPYFGVASLSFYADASKFLHHHLSFAETVFSDPSFGDYIVLDTQHVRSLGRILGDSFTGLFTS